MVQLLTQLHIGKPIIGINKRVTRLTGFFVIIDKETNEMKDGYDALRTLYTDIYGRTNI